MVSWRDVKLIAHTASTDGLHWDLPQAVLTAVPGSGWEGDEVNRPTIVVKDGLYHMWYTGQMFAKENQMSRSCIGYAVSEDGINWKRRQEPVLYRRKHGSDIVLCVLMSFGRKRKVYTECGILQVVCMKRMRLGLRKAVTE